MAKKEEKKVSENHPHHHYITHIRYLKKTISFLTLGLEVGLLLLVGVMIFLFSTIDQLETARFELSQQQPAIIEQPVLPNLYEENGFLHYRFMSSQNEEILWTVHRLLIHEQFSQGAKARAKISSQNTLHAYYRSQSIDTLQDCRSIFLDHCSGSQVQTGLSNLQTNEVAFTQNLNAYLASRTHPTVDIRGKKALDFSIYVNDSSFSSLAQSIDQVTESEEEFLEEVWYLVKELTTYSSEITETPQYPLETLFITGGDCEDTSILVASIVKAANQAWDVNLVYMDINNPQNLKKVNHVLVEVVTQNSSYLIETTGEYKFNPFEEVDGVRVRV